VLLFSVEPRSTTADNVILWLPQTDIISSDSIQEPLQSQSWRQQLESYVSLRTTAFGRLRQALSTGAASRRWNVLVVNIIQCYMQCFNSGGDSERSQTIPTTQTG
jgi:hypothetical protein